MAALPSQIGKGIIQGRLVVGASDSGDTDTDPDLIPAKGKVIFTPTITHIPEAEVTPELVLTLNSIVGILDAEGYLCAYDIDTDKPLGRGVTLFATDSGPVTDWTYTVSYCLEPIDGFSYHIPEHSIFVETGSTQNLANLVSVPSSEGSGTHQLELLVIRAEKAVRDSQAQLDTSATQVNEAKASAAAAASSAQAIEDAIQEVAGLTDVNVSAPIKDPSSATREALDGLYSSHEDLTYRGQIGYKSKLVDDLPSTYWYGVSHGLQSTNPEDGGWPNPPGFNNGFALVTTIIESNYRTALQIVSGYHKDVTTEDTNTGILYRMGKGDSGWTKFHQLANLEDLQSITSTIHIIESEDLNTIPDTGSYWQSSSAAATADRNYPAQMAGLLTQTTIQHMKFQTYQGFGRDSDGNRFFWRGKYNDAWSSWREASYTPPEAYLTQWTNLPVDSGISKINDAGWQPVQYRAAHGRLDFRGSIMRTSSRSFGNTSTTIVKASSMPPGIMAAIGKDTAFPIVVEDSNATTQIGRAVINNAGDLVFTFNVNATIIVVDLAQLSFPLP